MNIRASTKRSYDQVYFCQSRGLVLYINPSVDDQSFKDNFKQYKKQVDSILLSLVEILNQELQLKQKDVMVLSKIESNHPANKLLNLISFFESDMRIGYGQNQKFKNGIQHTSNMKHYRNRPGLLKKVSFSTAPSDFEKDISFS